MTERSALKNATEEADCPMCEGAGGSPRTSMECCGMPAADGSCCGYGKAVARLEQCEWCGGSGKLPILHADLLKACMMRVHHGNVY